MIPIQSWASPGKDVRIGNRLYQKGNYEGATLKYQEAAKKAPNSDIVNFNLGSGFYKKGEYDKSLEYFRKALLGSDKILQSQAHYNLANALYKSGMVRENSDLSSAIQSLEEALTHYEKRLADTPKDTDAQFNYDFVKKELERLKKKQQEQRQKEQQQKSQDDQQKFQEQQSQNNAEQQKADQQKADQQKSEQQQLQQQDNFGQQAKEDQGQQTQLEEDKDRQSNQKNTRKSASAQQESGEGQEESQAGSGDGKELTPQEAKWLLEGYEQSEEPKGLLLMRVRRGEERPVEKDW